jgi:hypothetical protein
MRRKATNAPLLLADHQAGAASARQAQTNMHLAKLFSGDAENSGTALQSPQATFRVDGR